MHEYFSYYDTISKRLSFLDFDGVTYKTIEVLPKNLMKDNTNYKNYKNINLVFSKNSIWINDVKTEKSNFKDTLISLIELSSEGKESMLHLNFNQNILYQDYLFYRTIIRNLSNENILINKNEFIFNENKI